MSLTQEKIKAWIEAMRLRTLPVSVAGVFAGTACAAVTGRFRWLPALICLVFAILAQIVSNFANEYYDFRNGLDKKGREGFRRGVTEGDLSPRAMRNATFGLLLADCLLGCSLIYWGGFRLIPVGVAIAVFAVAYSAGPYPLSHHGLGDIAVIIFFGIVPVSLTCYLQTGDFHDAEFVWPVSIATGLMAANVLIVNNYRDMDDDAAVNKHTTVVIFGRKIMSAAYLLSGIVADIMILFSLKAYLGIWILLPAGIFMVSHIFIWWRMRRLTGHKLNPLLGMTAMNLLLFCIILLIEAFAV